LNLILENSKFVEYYTYLHLVFQNVPEFIDYFWLITDLECNIHTGTVLDNNQVPTIIDGKSLNRIIQGEEIQFVWGVLSGFDRQIEKIPEKLPYADGNSTFWEGKPKTQITGADVEIVCWDSSCTIFININEEIEKKLRFLYPDIMDLDEQNKHRVIC
jgi:hypothetical protein